MARENSYFDAMRALKENNEALAKLEESKIQASIDKKNEWIKKYSSIRENRIQREKFHGKLLEAARDDIFGTCLKSIYITAMAEDGISESGIILAESMVEGWISENGGASAILGKKQKNSYLLARLAQIVEENAQRVVKEVESISEADDDDDTEETKEEEKTTTETEEEEVKDDKGKKEEVKETEKDSEEETEVEDDEEEKDEDFEKVKDIDTDDDEAEQDVDLGDDDEEESEPDEDDIDFDSYKDEDLELDDEEDSEDKDSDDTDDSNDDNTDDDSDDDTTDDTDTADDIDDNADEESTDDTTGDDSEADSGEEDTTDVEVSDSDVDEEPSEADSKEAEEELLDDDDDEEKEDSEVNDAETDDECDPEECDTVDANVMKELEDEEDVKKAVETIHARVADAEQKFIEKNAEDKKKVDELLHKISKNVNTVEEIDDEDDTESQIAQEAARISRRKITELSNKRVKTVFEAMAYEVSRSAHTNKIVKEQYSDENGQMDIDGIMERTRVMYGFLETLNTLKLENVTEAYVKDVLDSINK